MRCEASALFIFLSKKKHPADPYQLADRVPRQPLAYITNCGLSHYTRSASTSLGKVLAQSRIPSVNLKPGT